MNIEIICPLYNAEKYVLSLHRSLLNQQMVDIINIQYILTDSNDNTESIMNENDIKYKKISKDDFSHSLTRETAALNSNADIIVFISQDIVIEDNNWLFNLINPIIDDVADACYSRQLTKFNNIEKYTREANYSSTSLIKTKDSIKELGLNTFFFSDAASAIKRDVFVELNGYDNKNLPINEDMYLAYKIIMHGYRIKYCADSIIYHSHDFKLSELYDRYKLTGRFFKENNYLDQYGTTGSGAKLAKYILKRAIQEKNVKVLLRYPFDMTARYIGMKVGKRKNEK